jgi:replicative DNA helicase
MIYTRDWQLKFLCALISDPNFFSDAEKNLHIDDFDIPACRLVFEIVRRYYRKHEAMPTYSVIGIEIERACTGYDLSYSTAITSAEIESLGWVLKEVHRCYSKMPNSENTPYFKSEMKTYLAQVRMAKLNSEFGTSAEHKIEAAVKIHDDLNKINGEDIEFENALDDIPEDLSTDALRVATGVPPIDLRINNGLKQKQIALLVAATGVGKTCGMINFAVNNAIAGLNSLFITLENPATMIKQRFQSIVGYFDASLFNTPLSKWPSDALERRKIVTAPSFPYAKSMTIADRSTKAQTMSDIEAIICKWKETMLKRGLSEDECPVVYIDWIEKIDPTGLKHLNKSSNSSDVWQRVMESIGEIARRNNIVAWTAEQATRKAQASEWLKREDIAHSSHILDPVDVSIGIAPVKVDEYKGRKGAVSIDDDDDSSTAPVCDRKLRASFLKIREGAGTNTACEFYQCPTLKFFPEQVNYKNRLDIIKRKGLLESYNIG